MKPTRAWLLTPAMVSVLVPAVPGVYILGRAHPMFTPVYAGRSDANLKRRLAVHARRGFSTYFTWRPCIDSREAFFQECVLYHLLRETRVLENQRHPDAPSHHDVQCPWCEITRRVPLDSRSGSTCT
jgi:hypothetical protein